MLDLSKLKPNDWGPATVLIVLIVLIVVITGAILLITTGRLPEGYQQYADDLTKLGGVAGLLGGARAVHLGLKDNAAAKAVSNSTNVLGSTATFALDPGDRQLSDATENDVTPEMIARAMASEALTRAAEAAAPLVRRTAEDVAAEEEPMPPAWTPGQPEPPAPGPVDPPQPPADRPVS